LNFEIRREFIVEDSLNELVKDNLNFRKTLKIKFVGEPGVDEGGV
jgi:E3 ubiquitin-protein ligase HECTD2